MTPRFLELAVATGDVLESLTFYKQLGFTEATTSDAIDHPYAVVTDGAVAIGLHGSVESFTELRYVRENVRRFVLDQTERGIEFAATVLSDEAMHSASLDDPYGHRLTWVEARTFSPPGAETPASLCGEFLDITLPVAELYAAARFWAPYSESVVAERDEPPAMRFDTHGITVTIGEYPQGLGPSVSFLLSDAAALQDALDRFDLAVSVAKRLPGSFAELVAPEGTRLTLWRADPLAETVT